MRVLISFLTLAISFLSCRNTTEFTKGKLIYEAKCQSCHMDDGSGLGTYIPSLKKPDLDYMLQICVIKKGQGQKNLVMPGFKLTDVESANLINYINEQFGNKKVWLPKDFSKTICTNQAK